MRAIGLLLVEGSHRNIEKSSDPDASRSGRPLRTASYLDKISVTTLDIDLSMHGFLAELLLLSGSKLA